MEAAELRLLIVPWIVLPFPMTGILPAPMGDSDIRCQTDVGVQHQNSLGDLGEWLENAENVWRVEVIQQTNADHGVDTAVGVIRSRFERHLLGSSADPGQGFLGGLGLDHLRFPDLDPDHLPRGGQVPG
jgi:hypothetical protein